MRGIMHHIDLTVTDPARSAPLYAAVLSFMGYQHRQEFEWRLSTPMGHTSISLNPAQGTNASRSHDRYSPGLHHFAWRAGTREDVDRFCDLLQDIGAEILDAPDDYPQYNSRNGYYAVFFADPDGLKLEYAWTPD
jgi:catechol 2,3-dioxygenase-like lactoylglutathione lyase family enzyme